MSQQLGWLKMNERTEGSQFERKFQKSYFKILNEKFKLDKQILKKSNKFLYSLQTDFRVISNNQFNQ